MKYKMIILGLILVFLTGCSMDKTSHTSNKSTSTNSAGQVESGKKEETKSPSKTEQQQSHSAIDKGIKVTITRAAYDGNALVLIFKVSGENLPVLNINDKARNSATSYFEYLIPNDPTVKQQMWVTKDVQFKKGENNTYIGEVLLNCRYNNLPDNYPFKINFLYMAGKQGNWIFEIPLKKQPNKTVKLNGISETKDHKYKVVLDDMIIGEASTTFHLHSARPTLKHGQLNLKIEDNHGVVINFHNGYDQWVNETNGIVQEKTLLEYSAIPPEAEYLMIYPEVDIYGQVVKVSKKLPAIKVNLK